MRRHPNSTIAFKQKVIRDLKAVEETSASLPQHILVCVSGGVDSVVLLNVLMDIRRLFGMKLSVGHVHHGLSKDKKVDQFRRDAQLFVENLAESMGLKFYTNLAKESAASSESELRKFRFGQLEKWREFSGAEGLALGHHAEDLLETQLMRLMRGSAHLGLGAMSIWSLQNRLRPFLNIHKVEILDYAKQLDLNWLDDPSNAEMTPLRNRVRDLLKRMDQVLPGATNNLHLSLQRLVRLNSALERSWEKKWLNPCLTVRGIDRRRFMELPRELKLQLLAIFARKMGIENYTSGQLEELRKRLDQKQKSLTFTFLGRFWDVSLDSISVK